MCSFHHTKFGPWQAMNVDYPKNVQQTKMLDVEVQSECCNVMKKMEILGVQPEAFCFL